MNANITAPPAPAETRPAWADDLLDACRELVGPSEIDECMDRIRTIVERAE